MVAQRGLEESLIWDAVNAIEPEEARWRFAISETISACVYSGNERAFASATIVDMMLDEQLWELGRHAREALRTISPTYLNADHVAWKKTLVDGAEHFSNFSEALLLGSCESESMPRPDYYFGGPLSELTDGQLMAYRAAAAVVNRMRKSG